ncbi:MAG: cytochrome c maturation protein CcmE [Actinomycetota bacterium]
MKARYVVAAVLCVVAIGWMVALLQRNVVFFKTVSEAVDDRSSDGTRTMRIGGGVVPGSIDRRGDGVDFSLTEGGITVSVRHSGTEPQMFEDCAPVVAEGRWAERGDRVFVSSRLLIKHDNDYEAPPTGATGPTCPDDPIQ